MITQPCTCGGSNENCSRCFGTGTMVIGVTPGRYFGPETGGYEKAKTNKRAAGSATRTRVVHVKRKDAKHGLTQCLICREVVGGGQLGLHYSAKHSGAHNMVVRAKKRDWKACPVCSLTVKELAKHMRAHQTTNIVEKSLSKETAERARLIKPGSNFMFISPATVAAKSRCSICQASVKHIERHLRKAHPTLSHEEYTEAVQKAFREMKALVANATGKTNKTNKTNKKDTFRFPKANLSSSTGRIMRDARLGRDASYPAQGGRVESNRSKH